jgi:hypothetical protein
MRTARQPTIKTLLLLMAVVAVQCEAMSVIVTGRASVAIVELVFWWTLIVTGILFWTVLPLAIAIFIRSMRRAGAVGFGLGLLSMLTYLYSRDHFDSHSPSNVDWVWRGIVSGPFGCLARIRGWWWDTHSYPMPMPLVIAVYSPVVIIYTMTCVFVAKSCRVRERPSRVA